MKSRDEIKFRQDLPLTTELAALEHLKNRCLLCFSVAFYLIRSKFTGTKVMHNILVEFEFRPDRTTDYGVSCPWRLNEENSISTFSRMFFYPNLLILACNEGMHKGSNELRF